MTKTPYLAETREWRGIWWSPDHPNTHIPGVLRFDLSQGLRLDLIGGFPTREWIRRNEGTFEARDLSPDIGTLHGLAEGTEISLFECRVTSWRDIARVAMTTSPDVQSVQPLTATVGMHLIPEELRLRSFHFGAANLHAWCGQESIVSTSYPRGTAGGFLAELQGSLPEPLGARHGTTHFTLNHTLRRPGPVDTARGHSRSLATECNLTVRPGKPMSLDEAKQLAFRLQQLTTLATGASSGILWMQAEPAQVSQSIPTVPVVELGGRKVDIYFKPSVRSDPDSAAVPQQQVLFTCAAIPFENQVPQWLELSERLRAGVGLLLGLVHAPATYVETNLMSAAMAAEAIHRRLTRSDSPSKKLTLRHRLNALSTWPDAAVVELFLPDAQAWSATLVKIRNQLAHDGEAPDFTPNVLAACVDVTKALLMLVLVHELGMDVEIQRELVAQNPLFQHARQSAALLSAALRL